MKVRDLIIQLLYTSDMDAEILVQTGHTLDSAKEFSLSWVGVPDGGGTADAEFVHIEFLPEREEATKEN